MKILTVVKHRKPHLALAPTVERPAQRFNFSCHDWGYGTPVVDEGLFMRCASPKIDQIMI